MTYNSAYKREVMYWGYENYSYTVAIMHCSVDGYENLQNQ